MKSKSPSPASARSTPRAHSRAPSLRAAAVALAALFLAACYVPPSGKDNPDSEKPETPPSTGSASSETEVTAPNLNTEAAIRETVTRSLTIDTPTPGWELDTLFLYKVGDELWCLHRLIEPEGMVAQMLSTTETSFSFVPPESPVPPIQHFVTGKTWNWTANPEVTFLDSFDSLQPQLENAALITLRQVAP